MPLILAALPHTFCVVRKGRTACKAIPLVKSNIGHGCMYSSHQPLLTSFLTCEKIPFILYVGSLQVQTFCSLTLTPGGRPAIAVLVLVYYYAHFFVSLLFVLHVRLLCLHLLYSSQPLVFLFLLPLLSVIRIEISLYRGKSLFYY